MAKFHSWQVTALRHGASGNVVAGRLQAGATLTLEEIVVGGTPRSITAPAPYELFGPGDVQRLAPGTITRRYPPPGASDAENTKRALVEFSHTDTLDLPWRYSPDPALPAAIRPWLVLVVGLPTDVVPGRDGRVTLSPQAQADHPLGASHQWAHVHEIDGDWYSRILSPLKLEPQRAYVACLVPAYVVEPDGTLRDAWPVVAGQPVRVACYDSWGFRTGEGGDFGEIAKRLRTPVDGELKEDFGRAKLHCRRRGPAAAGEPATVALAMGGALQRVSMVGAPPDPVASWLAAETAALTAMPPMPPGRWLLTSPRYHAPFTVPGTMPSAGWSAQFHTDPRHRGAAGLGAWAAIAWQDRIAKAAATRAGDLAIARERIGNVALGVEVSRSLWFRHMPPDPVDKLAVLGAMLGRMPVNAQQTVSSALTGRTPGMVPAIWSSAARRALRPGPARSALTRDGVIAHRVLLEAAAACPVAPDDPDAIWHKPRADAGPLLKDAVRRAFDDARQADDMFRMLMDSETTRDLNRLAAVLDALTPDAEGRVDPDKVIRAVREPGQRIDEPATGQWVDTLAASRPRCRPVDLTLLGQRVADAVDPFAARPPVVNRVLATLPGIVDIGPVEIEPELDLPLWQFLNEAAPDWMLPGIGDLQQDRVVGLATHAVFVEGVLAGANHQALGELRWRNVPIAPRWSPLRKFWQRTGGQFDIHPIRHWPADTALGGAALTPTPRASEAVVLFKTPLFRRYPDTVVYLYQADADWTVPPANQPLDESRKQFPTFPGRIGPDVAFFAFNVAPEDLGKYWVVLEEPPAGYRFYSWHDGQDRPSGTVADGAAYGVATFAPPVRVMIGKLELA